MTTFTISSIAVFVLITIIKILVGTVIKNKWVNKALNKLQFAMVGVVVFSFFVYNLY